MKDLLELYFENRKPVTSALCVGVVSLTAALETGVLPLPSEVERQIQAMAHTSHAPAPSATTNLTLSASGNSTASLTTYSVGTGLTFDTDVHTWTARVDKG